MRCIVRNTARRHARRKWEAQDKNVLTWEMLSREEKIYLIDNEVVTLGGRKPTPMRRRPRYSNSY